jgi:hypothetical protein
MHRLKKEKDPYMYQETAISHVLSSHPPTEIMYDPEVALRTRHTGPSSVVGKQKVLLLKSSKA